MVYFSAVVASAWYGGMGPALLCALLSGAAANYLFLSPRFSLSLHATGVANTLIFIGEALVISSLNRSRLLAKRAADEQQSLREIVLGSVGDAVFTTNIRGQIETLNPAAQSLTGWSAGEAKGRVCGSVVRLDTRVHPVSEALESGLPYRSPKPLAMHCRNGAVAHVEVSVAPLTETNGAISGCIVTLRDRSAQIQSHRDLESALEKTNSILESISNAFVHFDSDWQFTYVNGEAERALQRPRESLIGKSAWDEFDAILGTTAEKELKRAAAERVPVKFENFYRPFSAWFEVHAFPSADGMSITFHDITSRKRMEAERQLLLDQSDEERRLLGAIVDSLPAGVLIVDSERKIILSNERAARTLGLAAIEEVTEPTFEGYNAFRLETGKPLRLEEYAVMRSLRDGVTILNLDTWMHSEDGDRLLEVSSTPLLESTSATSHVSAAVLIVQDVTERRRTQNALVETRQQMTHVLEGINEGFVIVDKDLRYTYLNPAAERLLRLETGQALGQEVGAVFGKDNVSNIILAAQYVQRMGLPSEFETHYEPLGCWFACKFYPAPDGGVTAFFADVTEARKARQALEQSERRYKSLVTATAQIVWDSGPDGNLAQPQETWTEFTGQQWPEHSGTGLVRMIHPEDQARLAGEWERNVRSGKPFQVEYRLWHAASGEHRECICRAVPLHDDRGVLQQWIGTITDVHDTKRLEKKLLQSAKLESLGVLAGGIAHDFNNLLTGIMGSASFLLEEIAPENPLRSLVQTVCNASDRAAQLTRQMLAYSGKGRFLLEVVDLSTQIQQISELLHASIPRNVEIVWDVARDPLWVQVDIAQLQQLVMNLVINGAEAVDAEKRGRLTLGTQPHVFFEQKETSLGDLPRGEYAVLRVSDTGCGMDEYTRLRIFDPFFTTKFTGRGLGLAAVLGIVRAHSGGIEVETEQGKGTTFHVYLPLSPSPEIQLVDTIATDPVQLATGTILVVDDEALILETAMQLLQAHGWNVLTATNGAEALELLTLHAQGISLLLLDVAMPVMGGVETARRVRETDQHLPIVVMSGYDEQETLRQFPDPVDGFLPKPFTYRDLQRVLTIASTVHPGNIPSANERASS